MEMLVIVLNLVFTGNVLESSWRGSYSLYFWHFCLHYYVSKHHSSVLLADIHQGVPTKFMSFLSFSLFFNYTWVGLGSYPCCSLTFCWTQMFWCRVFKFTVEVVDLSGENAVDSEWMAYLGAYRYLRSLNLSNCHRLSSSGIWAIAGML